MEDKMEELRAHSVYLCNRLVNEFEKNGDDADLFFGGEMHKAYIKANDKAIEKAKNIRTRIKNL